MAEAARKRKVDPTTDLGDKRVVLRLWLGIDERLQCDRCRGYMSYEDAYLVYEGDNSGSYHYDCL
jgi:hypothetical protein